MQRMKQAHFIPLNTQGNIYTIVPLALINNTKKFLVATLKRQVFTFEYVENNAGVLIPTTKEIPFTYIPSGAEIISIDVFNKSKTKNEFVIGITIIKQSYDNNSLETYLNVYSDEDFNIDSIAQNCLSVKLNFVPYHLTHTFLLTWNANQIAKKEIVFLLSGSDNKMHIFKEVNDGNGYKEIDQDCFPEFYDIPSIIMWTSVQYIEDYAKRITAFGCEDGYLRLVTIDTKTNAVLRSHSVDFLHAISQTKLYIVNDSIINLIAVDTLSPTVLFNDIVKDGLSNAVTLRRNDLTSVTACCAAADIDFDGRKEIVLGNSLHEVLLYKDPIGNGKEFSLFETLKLEGPIFQIFYLDITGDGISELIIFTIRGLYIYQHKTEDIRKILKDKMDHFSIPYMKEMAD